jgi:hypothetical protein
LFQNQLIRAASTPATDVDEGKVEMRKKETDEVQLRRDGALNQFINELSSNIHGRRYSEVPNTNANVEQTVVNEKDDDKSAKLKNDDDVMKGESTIEKITDKVSDSPTTVEIECKSSSNTLAQPSHFVTVIEVKEATSSETATTTTTTSTTTATPSFKSIRSGYENVIIENNKRNSNLMNMSEMDRSSNTSSFNSARPTAPIALLQDAKKKIPPR